MEIEEYYEELKKLSIYHTQQCNIEVSEEMVMDALILTFSDLYKFEWEGDFWELDISSEERLKRWKLRPMSML